MCISRINKNKGRPNETPTTSVPTIGNYKNLIPFLILSKRMNPISTIADTKTSIHANDPIRVCVISPTS